MRKVGLEPWARRLVFAFCACAFACACGSTPTGLVVRPTSLRSVRVPVRTVVLDNGMHVLLNEDHRVPLVAVNLMYGVGSSQDPADKPQLAHTFEHLMFQGSAHVPPGGHSKYLEAIGARCGATTSIDVTEYFETVPANQIELALWLESDRMGFLLDGLDQKKLDRVRPVIENELRQREDNRRNGHAPEYIFAAIFPADHPYHRAGSGAGDGAAMTVDDLRGFGRRYYTPDNASLTLSGDFDPATAVALVDRYFGSLPPGHPPAPVPSPPVALNDTLRLEAAASIDHERLFLAWPTPALGQPGDAELDVVALTLREALLPRALLAGQYPIASSVRARQHSFQRSSLFVIEVELRPGKSAANAMAVIDEQLGLLRKSRVTKAWSSTATRDMLTMALARMQTLEGRADRLNRYDLLLHNPNYLWQEIARYWSIVPGDISEAVRGYLPENRRAILVVHPDRTAPVGGRLVKAP